MFNTVNNIIAYNVLTSPMEIDNLREANDDNGSSLKSKQYNALHHNKQYVDRKPYLTLCW